MMLVAQPGARTWCHAFRGGRCAAAILTDRKQPKNKNTWIMIYNMLLSLDYCVLI